MAAVGALAFELAGQRLRAAALVVVAVGVFGFVACDALLRAGFTPGPGATITGFFTRYLLDEPPFLWLLVGFGILVTLLARPRDAVVSLRAKPITRSLTVPAVAAALGVFGATLVGAWALARLPLPSGGDRLAIGAAVHAAGIPVWVAPMLAAVSVLGVAGASARLWPADPRRGRMAILYVATSTQFLLTSTTGVAAGAQLCLNMLWLCLALRDDVLGLAAAPIVGAGALGIGSPLPHALFVAPFLVRLVRTMRPVWIGYYAAVYAAAAVGWYRWAPTPGAPIGWTRPLAAFALPGARAYLAQGMHVSLLLTWQAPAMTLFLVAAALLVRSLKAAERDLAAGLALALLAHLMLAADGRYALGSGYLYPMLGNAALLAGSATGILATQRGGRLVPRLVAASMAAALLVQLPLRVAQAASPSDRASAVKRLTVVRRVLVRRPGRDVHLTNFLGHDDRGVTGARP